MSSSDTCVLRIQKSDDPEAYVLVHVSPSGKAPLDLKLVATEGDYPYATSVKQSNLKKLRFKNYQGSEEEFEQILGFVLKRNTPEQRLDARWSSGVEVVASVRESGEETKELVITIRRRIDTITQRVAVISLTQDDDQTIELFEWTGLMISKADALNHQVTSLSDRMQAAEATIAELNSQLDQLVTSRKDHEDYLMANFVRVLNEKKLKIRNQQRLLAAGKIDPEKISELRTAIPSKGRRDTQKSRPRKRKAAGVIEEHSEAGEDFENMDIDNVQTQANAADREASDISPPETPQPLEDETESDDEDIASPLHDLSEDAAHVAKSPRPSKSPPVPKSPPPRRDLPFAKKAATSAHKGDQPKGTQSFSDGETDDDEL